MSQRRLCQRRLQLPQELDAGAGAALVAAAAAQVVVALTDATVEAAAVAVAAVQAEAGKPPAGLPHQQGEHSQLTGAGQAHQRVRGA